MDNERRHYVRRILAAVIAVASAGTLVELLLIEHVEAWDQWIPVVILGVGILVSAGAWFDARWAWRSMGITGWVYVASGLLGIFFHVKGNREFEMEMYPDLSGLALLGESLQGAFPSLAPGTMVYLGVLALVASTHRLWHAPEHPQT